MRNVFNWMLLIKGSSSFLPGGVIFLRQRQKNIYVELLVWTLVGNLPSPLLNLILVIFLGSFRVVSLA